MIIKGKKIPIPKVYFSKKEKKRETCREILSKLTYVFVRPEQVYANLYSIEGNKER